VTVGDYRVHATFSDGEDELAAYVERALQLERVPSVL